MIYIPPGYLTVHDSWAPEESYTVTAISPGYYNNNILWTTEKYI